MLCVKNKFIEEETQQKEMRERKNSSIRNELLFKTEEQNKINE